MSNQISTSFQKTYEPMFQMLAQQRTSFFKSKCRVKVVTTAEEWYMDQLGAVDVTEITSQRQAIVLSNTPHQRRQVVRKTFYFADTVEEQDLVKMKSNPTMDYTQNGLFALERRIDKLIIDAAFGTAQIGKDGGTAVTFATDTNGVGGAGGQTIVHGSTGLTYGKFLAVRKAFHNRNVFPSTICLAIGPEQEEDLFGINEFINIDFNNKKPVGDSTGVPEGFAAKFMEFEIYRSTQLAITTTVRDCIAWDKMGIGVIIGIAPRVILENRPDMAGSPLQVQVVMQVGASRLDGDRVIKLQCSE
jgi:hypothetical protein